MTHQTRRDFLAALTATLGASAWRPASAFGQRRGAKVMTIQNVIDLIIDAIPGAPQEGSVDTVKSGDPSQPVTGIVTTFLATSAVIETAISRQANLIITHEPTFYNHLDEVDWLQDDPVYTAKRRLLEEHNLVVWRFHDYWHLHRPDGITMGALKKLGWQAYASPDELNLCLIPPTPLADLMLFLKETFGSPTVRVMGDPAMTCRRVGLLLGAWGGRRQIQFLGRDDVEVLVCGEVREWETTEYVRDAVQAGFKKGLIVVGHALSEEPGMEGLVPWLQPRVPDIPVTHVPAGDPFRYM